MILKLFAFFLPVPFSRVFKMRYFLFAFVALGCNEQKLNSLGGDNAADGPQIEVDPLSLNFGVVRDDDDPALRTFTIKSVGFGNLNVEGIEISGRRIGYSGQSCG